MSSRTSGIARDDSIQAAAGTSLRLPILVLLTGAGVAMAAGEAVQTFRFVKADLGKVPSGWKAEKTGKGEGSVWKVVEDSSGPAKSGFVLAQTAVSPGSLFNLCVVEGTSFQDVNVKVAFKAVKGNKDQGGGVVWRYRDANNYYIARFNPLEDNFRLYKVVSGKRLQLATRENIKLPTGAWHTLAVTMVGDKITCLLNGKKYLEAADETFKTAGSVGLWTKADAQSYFDDFQVHKLAK